MQHKVKIYSQPVKLLNCMQRFSAFFRPETACKKNGYGTSDDCVCGPPFVAHLLFGWGGTEYWIFFCVCGGPPNFFDPGPSNGVKRVVLPRPDDV